MRHGIRETLRQLHGFRPYSTWKTPLLALFVDDCTYSLPSEEKYSYYYEGLPSSPRLVATISSKKNESHHLFRWWAYKKQLRAITDHSIGEKWHPGSELSNDILAHLDGIGLQWTTMDILQIGYVEMPPKELKLQDDEITDVVTLFISVAAHAISWATAMWAASNCKRILKHHGNVDVEVDIKESTLSQVTYPSREEVPETQPNEAGLLWIDNRADPSCDKVAPHGHDVGRCG